MPQGLDPNKTKVPRLIHLRARRGHLSESMTSRMLRELSSDTLLGEAEAEAKRAGGICPVDAFKNFTTTMTNVLLQQVIE